MEPDAAAIRLSRGASAASCRVNSSGDITRWVVPLRQGVYFSLKWRARECFLPLASSVLLSLIGLLVAALT